MAKSPDPNIKLTSSKGVTRTLDDWATMFHLAMVVLPPRPEAGMFVPVARRIFQVLGDADCRTLYCVVGDEFIARGVVGDAEQEELVLCDPDGSFVQSVGLTHLPAFVHLRQDTTLAGVAEGWDPDAWQDVATELGRAMAWSVPHLTNVRIPVPAAYPA